MSAVVTISFLVLLKNAMSCHRRLQKENFLFEYWIAVGPELHIRNCTSDARLRTNRRDDNDMKCTATRDLGLVVVDEGDAEPAGGAGHLLADSGVGSRQWTTGGP